MKKHNVKLVSSLTGALIMPNITHGVRGPPVLNAGGSMETGIGVGGLCIMGNGWRTR